MSRLVRQIGRAGLGRVLDDRRGDGRSGCVGCLRLERRIAGWCGFDLRREETRQDHGAAEALAESHPPDNVLRFLSRMTKNHTSIHCET